MFQIYISTFKTMRANLGAESAQQLVGGTKLLQSAWTDFLPPYLILPRVLTVQEDLLGEVWPVWVLVVLYEASLCSWLWC